MNLEGKRNLLVIRLSSLGDILLTTPVIRGIKNKYPSLKIDFLLLPQYADALKYDKNIANLIFYDKDSSPAILIESLKRNNYDAIIDFQNNKRSKEIIKNLRVEFGKFVKPTLDKFLLVQFKINRFKKIIPISERYASAVSGLELDELGAELTIPSEIVSSIKPDKKTIAFCPGSRHITKMWPIEYFVELGKIMESQGFNIVLLGGKEDVEICKYINIYVKSSVNLCTSDNLLQIATDMKNCRFVVCNDSGLMHAACAVKTPVVTFFGSSVKEFGFSPYNSKSLIIENNSLKCRPCSHIGLSDCPKKHFNCMKEIQPFLVAEKIMEFSENL